MLDQEKWRGYVHAEGLLPFLTRDFGKWFYHRDACIVDQQINRIMPDRGDQVVDAAKVREIVNQLCRFTAALFYCPAGFGQGNGVATMQEQQRIWSGEFYRDGAADA